MSIAFLTMVAVSTCGASRLTAADATTETSQPKKYALLIGCSEYRAAGIGTLSGPVNDVPLVAAMLKSPPFNFREQDIVRLVAPPAVARRPTYKNIVAAFETLDNQASSKPQIFIHLSGHGMQLQMPSSEKEPLQPAETELDGLDEVFLPEDADPGAPGGPKNVIYDDQLRKWLESMREKGATVWINFDCCHSGTLTKGLDQPRGIRPENVGVPAELMKRAREQAASRAGTKGNAFNLETSPLQLSAGRRDKGSLVAFYACQAFQTTDDLPRPEGATRDRENYHGMLTYTMVQALKRNQRPISYRELSQQIVAEYRNEYHSGGPTPFCEGDIDLEIFGVQQWPLRSAILLQKDEGRLSVSAGALLGLSRGTILSVHPPAGSGETDKLLGHVLVTALSAVRADVEICPPSDDVPAASPDTLPNLARCRIIFRPFDDMRVRLAIDDSQNKQDAPILNEALQYLPEEIKPLVRTTDLTVARWVLKKRDGRAILQSRAASIAAVFDDLPTIPNASYGSLQQTYRFGSAKDLGTQLGHDLRKIFAWQNLWRVARTFDASDKTADAEFGLKMRINRLQRIQGRLVKTDPGTVVHPDDLLSIDLDNRKGFKDMWVTALFLNPDLSIELIVADSIKAERPFKTIVWEATFRQQGVAGCVLFAIPRLEHPGKPPFDLLVQRPLGQRDTQSVSKGSLPDTQIGRLLSAITLGDGAKGEIVGAPTNPTILSQSWVSVPVRSSEPDQADED